MSEDSFSAEWLALREPADHRSREEALLEPLEREADHRGWSRVLDLGAGTGSNLRYLSARLTFDREWTLLDHDPALLARVPRSEGGRVVRTVRGDLATDGLEAIEASDMVTASALLDLVSDRWLRSLADRCVQHACGALFSLSYDGTIELDPAYPSDALVRDALNSHQQRDKGLGSALGPEAAHLARDLFESAGYRTWLAPSPWLLRGAGDFALTRALVGGWVGAATEQLPEHEAVIRAWAERRLDAITDTEYSVRVGHLDLLALPPA